MKTLNELCEELKAKQELAKSIYEGADEQSLTDENIKQLRELNKECDELSAAIEKLKVVESAKSVYRNSELLLAQPANKHVYEFNQPNSLYQRLAKNDTFKAWADSVHSQFMNLEPVLIEDSIKSIISQAVADSAGELTVPFQTGVIDNPFARPLYVRDFIGSGATDSNSVEFVRVTEFTDNTDGVAQATDIGDTSGSKPSSNIKFDRVNEPIKTIANTVTTTTNALADAGQLETLINQMLGFGLARAIDDQIINGGGGADLTGVLNTAGIQTIAFDTDILVTSMKAQTAVSLEFDDGGGGTQATAYFINPIDWQKFTLFKDGEGRYYWGGPGAVGAKTLWSLPVVVSNAVPAGTGLVGDWTKVIYYDRGQTSIRAFEQHADYARRNMVLFRAETRGALAVIRPKAIAKFAMSA